MPELPPIPSLMPERNFNALSLKDLLDAREISHVHLARKNNVIGTAIGRYLIRDADPNSKDAYAVYQGEKDELGPRRLDNSVITPWSWPCIIVFVREWRPSSDFRNDPQNFISPFIDLPDGRTVPVCVVEARPDEAAQAGQPMTTQNDEDDFFCGGLPVFSEVQDVDRFGTLGCLVTNGKGVFALTASHVAGFPGTLSRASLNGTMCEIGEADQLQITTLPFERVYPTLPGQFVDSCLDAGLIRLKSIRHWSGQVHGIGQVGELFSLDKNTLSLSIIGTPVRAHGAGSGLITGQVMALFYRYQSLGGFDYVADLLIGPRKIGDNFSTRPGDSGSIFFYDHVQAAARLAASKVKGKARAEKRDEANAEELMLDVEAKVFYEFAEAEEKGIAPPWRPLAIQWGGQRFFGAPASNTGESFPFALATSLGTACRALGVEIIRGFDIALPEYWGEVGHFTIGETACDLISINSNKLKALFRNNQRNIGFNNNTIMHGMVTGLGPTGFIPLADVPDDVWKKGGRGVKRGRDNPTHYADMDEQGANQGPTLFNLCQNPANISTTIWHQHYQDIGTPIENQGSLPFRVWQIFEEMIGFVENGEVNKYICAAGILAHYVGDACQPLHASRLANENGVHSPYETKMLNANRGSANGVIAKIQTGLTGLNNIHIPDGRSSAVALIRMMERVRGILPPQRIIDVWSQVGGPSSPNYQLMWQRLGDATGRCMAEGAILLASLWESAWVLGNGDQNITSVQAVDFEELRRLFEPNGTPGHGTQFLESHYIDQYPAHMS